MMIWHRLFSNSLIKSVAFWLPYLVLLFGYHYYYREYVWGVIRSLTSSIRRHRVGEVVCLWMFPPIWSLSSFKTQWLWARFRLWTSCLTGVSYSSVHHLWLWASAVWSNTQELEKPQKISTHRWARSQIIHLLRKCLLFMRWLFYQN